MFTAELVFFTWQKLRSYILYCSLPHNIFTINYFTEKAVEMEAFGADMISIKDMAGLLTSSISGDMICHIKSPHGSERRPPYDSRRRNAYDMKQHGMSISSSHPKRNRRCSTTDFATSRGYPILKSILVTLKTRYVLPNISNLLSFDHLGEDFFCIFESLIL